MKRFNLMLLLMAVISFTVVSCSKDHAGPGDNTGPGETENPVVGTWYIHDVDANIVVQDIPPVDESLTGLDQYKKFTFDKDGTYSLLKSTPDGDVTVTGKYNLNDKQDTLKLTQDQAETDPIANVVADLLSKIGLVVKVEGEDMTLKFDATDFTVSFGGNDVTADEVHVAFKLSKTPPLEPAEYLIGTWNVGDVSALIKAAGLTFDQTEIGLDQYKQFTFKNDGTYSLLKSTPDGDVTVTGKYNLNDKQDTLKLTQDQVETGPIAPIVNELLSTVGVAVTVSEDEMKLRFNATDYKVSVGGTEVTVDEVALKIQLSREQ